MPQPADQGDRPAVGLDAVRYDLNSQTLPITDAEITTTEYEYNSRGLKKKEMCPDHNPTTSPEDTDYGIIEFEFNPANRLELRTD